LVEEYVSGAYENNSEIEQAFNEFHISNFPIVVEGICECLCTLSSDQLVKGAELLVYLMQKDILNAQSVRLGFSKFLKNCDSNENELDCSCVKVEDTASALIAACICKKMLTFNIMDDLFDPLINVRNSRSCKYSSAQSILGKTLQHIVLLAGPVLAHELYSNNPMNISRFLPKDSINDDDRIENFLKDFNASAIMPNLEENIKTTKELESLIINCSSLKDQGQISKLQQDIKKLIKVLNDEFPESLEYPTTSHWLENSFKVLLDESNFDRQDTISLIKCISSESETLQTTILDYIYNSFAENKTRFNSILKKLILSKCIDRPSYQFWHDEYKKLDVPPLKKLLKSK